MFQGPQLVQHSLSVIRDRLINPVLPAEPEALPSDANARQFSEASSAVTRADGAGVSDVVTAFTRAGEVEAVARTQGLRAELVRAETMLQITQEAFTAIEVLYGGMKELAELALNENLTAAQRADLDAAFQELKQDIEEIVDATVFDGVRLLEGGHGPHGEYVIRLSDVGESGDPLDILIPSVSVIQLLDGYGEANLLSPEAARQALDGAENAARIFLLLGDMVELQRATLQQIFSTEVDPNQNLKEYVETYEAPSYAKESAQKVADIVLAGGKVPFDDQADRLRDILERLEPSRPPEDIARNVSGEVVPIPVAPVIDAGGPDSADPRPQGTGLALKITQSSLVEMRHYAEAVTASPPVPAGIAGDADVSFQAMKEFVSTVVPLNPPRPGGGQPDGEISVPAGVIGSSNGGGTNHTGDVPARSPSLDHVMSGLGGADIQTPIAAKAVVEIIDVALENLASITEIAVTDVPGRPPATEVDRSLAGLMGARFSPETPSLAPVSRAILQPVGFQPQVIPADNEVSVAERPADRVRYEVLPADQSFAMKQLDQIRLEAVLADAVKDAGRQAPTPLQPVRDPDSRVETAVPLEKSIYQAPSDHAVSAGATHSSDAGGFMSELIRADGMLHVAEIAIEQIDLHLDYLRGLAEEASGETSRGRNGLDSVFQFVKSNVIDSLARSTEAQGEKILSGGDGRDGAFVIRLSEGGPAGQGRDIAIPSMRVVDLSKNLSDATVRTSEAAEGAVGHIDRAGADVADIRDSISTERSLIQRLMSLEIAQRAT